jgi:hypothetical protein
MKRFVGIILVLAFFIFCIVDSIHGFLSSDGLHYFLEQPHRLLLVAVIGIVGGLTALGLSAWSQRLQRTLKLIALGLGGSLVLLAGCYFGLQFVNLPPELHSAIPPHTVLTILLCGVYIAGLVWFEFFQTLRSRDHVA